MKYGQAKYVTKTRKKEKKERKRNANKLNWRTTFMVTAMMMGTKRVISMAIMMLMEHS